MKHYNIAKSWNGSELDVRHHIQIGLELDSCGGLNVVIDAPFYDDPSPAQNSGSTWELWNYEVVEVFLVGPQGDYLEAEFGPHGHYLLLQLDGPRQVVAQELAAIYHADIKGKRWQGRAHIDAALLPNTIERLNCFSIHGIASNRQYCAWSPLPGSQPDFHQTAHFPHFYK